MWELLSFGSTEKCRWHRRKVGYFWKEYFLSLRHTKFHQTCVKTWEMKSWRKDQPPRRFYFFLLIKPRCWGNAEAGVAVLRGKLKQRRETWLRLLCASGWRCCPPSTPSLEGAPHFCAEGNTLRYFQPLCVWWSRYQPSATTVKYTTRLSNQRSSASWATGSDVKHLPQIRPTRAVGLGILLKPLGGAFPFNASLNTVLRTGHKGSTMETSRETRGK